MGANDDCRADAEQFALVTTAAFKTMGGEGLRTQPSQPGTARNTSFTTERAIYVQSGIILPQYITQLNAIGAKGQRSGMRHELKEGTADEWLII